MLLLMRVMILTFLCIPSAFAADKELTKHNWDSLSVAEKWERIGASNDSTQRFFDKHPNATQRLLHQHPKAFQNFLDNHPDQVKHFLQDNHEATDGFFKKHPKSREKFLRKHPGMRKKFEDKWQDKQNRKPYKHGRHRDDKDDVPHGSKKKHGKREGQAAPHHGQ